MFDTDKILNAISNIDDEILYAEGAVTTSLCMFDDKIDQMTKFCNDEEWLTEYIQEASVGTGISYNKSDSLIKRIWTFIRRVVHTIINKISDLMTKLKIRKFEYVETPMSFEDIKSDIDDISNVFGGLAEVMISEYITNNNGTDRSKAINELKAFLKKINDLKIFKTKNDDKPHGVKPDEFMKLRDKLRFMNQQMKDMSKRTDSFIRDTEKTNAFSNKQYEQYCRMIQQLFAKMNEATTKLFTSFKFKNAREIELYEEIKSVSKKISKRVSYIRNIINSQNYFTEQNEIDQSSNYPHTNLQTVFTILSELKDLLNNNADELGYEGKFIIWHSNNSTYKRINGLREDAGPSLGLESTKNNVIKNKIKDITDLIDYITNKIIKLADKQPSISNFDLMQGLARCLSIVDVISAEIVDAALYVNNKNKWSNILSNPFYQVKTKHNVVEIRYDVDNVGPELNQAIKEVKDIVKSIHETQNFDEYKILFDRLVQLCGFSKNCDVIQREPLRVEGKSGYTLKALGKKRTIKLKKNSNLYHVSAVNGLTELKPKFISNEKNIDSAVYYSSERVYFFVDNPGHRNSADNHEEYTSPNDSEHKEFVYIYDGNVGGMIVNIDNESQNLTKAVYIETEDPIPVREVTDDFT